MKENNHKWSLKECTFSKKRISIDWDKGLFKKLLIG